MRERALRAAFGREATWQRYVARVTADPAEAWRLFLRAFAALYDLVLPPRTIDTLISTCLTETNLRAPASAALAILAEICGVSEDSVKRAITKAHRA